jgi:hypothetical protein
MMNGGWCFVGRKIRTAVGERVAIGLVEYLARKNS